ncbi:hypothetical protein BCIN_11g04920 [Botrytis cinerea B05.10]|uniref:Uncharacterized protein n=1 Tax=Botryotinia fuckeliana (strain B05.10) TaxID=332648 RepID=A0A384JXB0_BOTFB|nr:hypothetical protein BCIN_11g04920 [Botrytis cinerea B05.10]ATZ55210.1 hypothetical protein BCIN_11g04920 [Botrytis cinerea B05.10]
MARCLQLLYYTQPFNLLHAPCLPFDASILLAAQWPLSEPFNADIRLLSEPFLLHNSELRLRGTGMERATQWPRILKIKVPQTARSITQSTLVLSQYLRDKEPVPAQRKAVLVVQNLLKMHRHNLEDQGRRKQRRLDPALPVVPSRRTEHNREFRKGHDRGAQKV